MSDGTARLLARDEIKRRGGGEKGVNLKRSVVTVHQPLVHECSCMEGSKCKSEKRGQGIVMGVGGAGNVGSLRFVASSPHAHARPSPQTGSAPPRSCFGALQQNEAIALAVRRRRRLSGDVNLSFFVFDAAEKIEARENDEADTGECSQQQRFALAARGRSSRTRHQLLRRTARSVLFYLFFLSNM